MFYSNFLYCFFPTFFFKFYKIILVTSRTRKSFYFLLNYFIYSDISELQEKLSSHQKLLLKLYTIFHSSLFFYISQMCSFFFTTERAISSLLRYLFSLLLTASLHVCYCFISLFFLFIVFMFDTNLFVLSIFLNFVTILLFFIRFTKIKIFPSFSILSDRARNIGNHG